VPPGAGFALPARRTARPAYRAAMTFAVIQQPQDVAGRNARQGQPGRQPATAAAAAAPAKPALSLEMLSRFRALIDDVTDELMQGQDASREACRADAITLLMATGNTMADEGTPVESPLMYLLKEEQHKAAQALGQAPAEAPAYTFMKV